MVQLFWKAFYPKKNGESSIYIGYSLSPQNINWKKYDKNPE